MGDTQGMSYDEVTNEDIIDESGEVIDITEPRIVSGNAKVEKWVEEHKIWGDAIRVRQYMCLCLYGGHVFYDTEEGCDTCLSHWVDQNVCVDCRANIIKDEPVLEVLSHNGAINIPFEVIAPEHCAFCMAQELGLT